MSTTVHIPENPSVTLTEEFVDPRPPDRLGFLTEGVIRPTRGLLADFEGSSMRPVRVDVAVDGSRTVTVDLEEEASLRLESIDIGVETADLPGVDDADGAGAMDSVLTDGDDRSAASAGAIAFTVEGTIRDLPRETLEDLEGDSLELESVTFSVSETVETDGGSPLDVLLEVSLFDYGVVVRRNGTIEVRAGGGPRELDLGLD